MEFMVANRIVKEDMSAAHRRFCSEFSRQDALA